MNLTDLPPKGATTHHTEATLKARHKEAIDVYEAWCDRVRMSGGQDRVAAVLQMNEALGWVEVCGRDLAAHRLVVRGRGVVVGRTVPHGRVGVSGHR